MRTPRSILLTWAASLALAPFTLTACGDSATEELTERAIEGAASEDADVDIDPESGDFSITTDDGTFSSGKGLPDGFPAEQVPVVEGDVVSGVSSTEGDGGGYVLYIQTDIPQEAAAVEEAASLLTEAGFTVDSDAGGDLGTFSTQQLTNDDFTVLVTGLAGDGGASVQYFVEPS